MSLSRASYQLKKHNTSVSIEREGKGGEGEGGGEGGGRGGGRGGGGREGGREGGRGGGRSSKRTELQRVHSRYLCPVHWNRREEIVRHHFTEVLQHTGEGGCGRGFSHYVIHFYTLQAKRRTDIL